MSEDEFTPEVNVGVSIEELAAALSNEELTKLAFQDNITDQAHNLMLRTVAKRMSTPEQLAEWLIQLTNEVLKQHSSEMLKRSNAVNGEQVSLQTIGRAVISLMNNSVISYCGEGDSGGLMPLAALIDHFAEMTDSVPADITYDDPAQLDDGTNLLLSSMATAWRSVRDTDNATTLGMMMFSLNASEEDAQLVDEIQRLDLSDYDPVDDSAKAFTAAGILATKGSMKVEVFAVNTLPSEGNANPDDREIARSVNVVRYNRATSRFETADVTEQVGDDMAAIEPYLAAAFFGEIAEATSDTSDTGNSGDGDGTVTSTKGSIKA